MRKTVYEIVLLRAIACLGIVLMHSCTLALNAYKIAEGVPYLILSSMQMALMFGTPIFIFISEFVLSYSYPERLPKGFFKKRIKFILIPFLFIGLIDALTKSIGTDFIFFTKQVILNFFFGNFHGYFILIIFQFYLLHQPFVKYIANRYSAKKVIASAILINIAYLSFFNFVDPSLFLNTQYAGVIWKTLNTMPFIAWIGYFAVAFYSGRNYKAFLNFIKHYQKQIISIFILSFMVLLLIHHSGILNEVHSKRIDVLFYTFSITFMLFMGASKLKNTPNFIMMISQYSFGIYLIHPFFNVLLDRIFGNLINQSYFIFVIIVSFLISVYGSIMITYILNKFKFGPYLVGTLKRKSKKNVGKMTSVVAKN